MTKEERDILLSVKGGTDPFLSLFFCSPFRANGLASVGNRKRGRRASSCLGRRRRHGGGTEGEERGAAAAAAGGYDGGRDCGGGGGGGGTGRGKGGRYGIRQLKITHFYASSFSTFGNSYIL